MTAARRARRPAGSSGPAAPGWVPLATVAGAGTLAIVMLLLSTVAWSRPTTRPTTKPADLRQEIGMTYAARPAVSGAYPGGQLGTGDPIYTGLVKTFDVHLAYRVAIPGGPAAGDLKPSGTRRVTAELRADNGWHRGYELLPRTAFTGAGFNADVSIDLARVDSLAAGLKKATGIEPGRYVLAVRSEIGLDATVPGPDRALRETFFPELAFTYDGRQLALAHPIPPANAGPPVSSQAKVTAVDVPATERAHLGALGVHPQVSTVRSRALLAALVLLLVAGLAERARRTANRNAAERVVRRIVLDEPTNAAARARVPGPRTSALAERQWPRPTTRR